jgi:CRP-like cAMP-binding protein
MISPETLRRYPVFSGASDYSLRRLATNAEQLGYAAGETLFNDGEPADRLYIVVSGEADIRYDLNDGSQRTVDTVVGGDLLGWSALVEPRRMTAHCVARVDTEVISIDASQLRDLCDADKNLGYGVLLEVASCLSHRLQGARVQLATAA